ncbi:hypothetical protein N7504_011649 [Penicillium tannophilum]|nr:hypothetical protein N7504_011649 [Penicillium tannophilum]
MPHEKGPDGNDLYDHYLKLAPSAQPYKNLREADCSNSRCDANGAKDAKAFQGRLMLCFL